MTVLRSYSHKSSSGPVQNAFDQMRPKRTSAEAANITIGNNTTTTNIGRPKVKRRRIYTPKYDLNGGFLPSPGKKRDVVTKMFFNWGGNFLRTENNIQSLEFFEWLDTKECCCLKDRIF